MRLEHGEHNESLSDFLLSHENGRYNDWVVTTAFYACIHFVEHKIFPCKVDGIDHGTFEEYCDYEHNEQNNHNSKHGLKANLVKSRIPGINRQYRFLMDACMNSRYNDYHVSNAKAKTCNDTMKVIKKSCI
ncbi:hypothetical protein [Pedobacter deserti]|uniref:hypothetical protein n=1 Tax=Pedobacter deserti TaxID=2817382 RepID=UPI00210E66DD|nr:hypothetical protein [Pedobacter sp. SYSU D00382]